MDQRRGQEFLFLIDIKEPSTYLVVDSMWENWISTPT
jgi:hypothetical protein